MLSKSPEYAITRSVVRLECAAAGGTPSSVGTGFFYQLKDETTDLARVFIFTNKHVIKNADTVFFTLSHADSLEPLNAGGQPTGRVDRRYAVALNGSTTLHSDAKVDLAAIDITEIVASVLSQGRKIRALFVDKSWLPEADRKQLFRDVESVLVIGYPRGLWDEHNNMPICRYGTTATHPLADYKGNSDFLIDVSAFQGSSGSPVFAYESPMYRTDEGSYSPGTRVDLIGVIWGVVEATDTGELRIIDVPSASVPVPVFKSSLNLGIALRADAILEVEAELRSRFPQKDGAE